MSENKNENPDVLIAHPNGEMYPFTEVQFNLFLKENLNEDYMKHIDNVYFIRLYNFTITEENREIFRLFRKLQRLEGIPKIETQNLSNMFYKSNISSGDIGDWDFSNVRNTSYMFSVSKYNSPLNKLDVSGVEDMKYMFYNAEYDKPLNNWKVTDVGTMQGMFQGSKYSHSLYNWKVSGVMNMKDMFASTKRHSSNNLEWFNNWNINPKAETKGIHRGA